MHAFTLEITVPAKTNNAVTLYSTAPANGLVENLKSRSTRTRSEKNSADASSAYFLFFNLFWNVAPTDYGNFEEKNLEGVKAIRDGAKKFPLVAFYKFAFSWNLVNIRRSISTSPIISFFTIHVLRKMNFSSHREWLSHSRECEKLCGELPELPPDSKAFFSHHCYYNYDWTWLRNHSKHYKTFTENRY